MAWYSGVSGASCSRPRGLLGSHWDRMCALLHCACRSGYFVSSCARAGIACAAISSDSAITIAVEHWRFMIPSLSTSLPRLCFLHGRQASGADLTFATHHAASSRANVKSKAPLETLYFLVVL